jgi:hypothetical protein
MKSETRLKLYNFLRFPTGYFVCVAAAAALLHSERGYAANWGPISSAGTTIISVSAPEETKSMWRNSKFHDYTIIGMDDQGGNDKFQIQFRLRQQRVVTVSLVADIGNAPNQNWQGFAFAFHQSKDDPNFHDLHRSGHRHEEAVHLTGDFFVCPGTYRVHGLWQGELGIQIIGKGGDVTMRVKIHPPGTRLMQEHPPQSLQRCTSF